MKGDDETSPLGPIGFSIGPSTSPELFRNVNCRIPADTITRSLQTF